MGIWDRVKFIGRTYINAYLDEEKRGHSSRPTTDPAAYDPGLDEPFDDEAFEREWEEFRKRHAGRPSTGGSGDSAGSHHTQSASTEPSLEQCYKRLECPVGTDIKSVRIAFRRLMKQYHPDRHAANPTEQAEATRICQLITEAYERLEKVLDARPARS